MSSVSYYRLHTVGVGDRTRTRCVAAGVAASTVGDVSLCHQPHSVPGLAGWLFRLYCSVAAAAAHELTSSPYGTYSYLPMPAIRLLSRLSKRR